MAEPIPKRKNSKRIHQDSCTLQCDLKASSLTSNDVKEQKEKRRKIKTSKEIKPQNEKQQTPNTTKIVQFYSKSKDMDDLNINMPNWRKRLSNFYPSSITVDLDNTGHIRHFATVEHAFHASKCLASNKPQLAALFEINGLVGADPIDAKRAGSRKGFEKYGAILNIQKWNKIRDGCMKRALMARLESDDVFRTILLETKRKGLFLVHFERGKNSYWGAKIDKQKEKEERKGGDADVLALEPLIVGRNRLGELLMELRDSL